MKIASFSIADYCEATEGMPHDVERLYFRMIMKMLSRESGLPDDDRENARMFGYDVRAYRPLKKKLLTWPNTIFIDDSLIKNARVENDLREYRERRAQAAKSGQIGGRSRGRSTGDRPEIDPDLKPKSVEIDHAADNEINDIPQASPSPSPTPSPIERDTDPFSLVARADEKDDHKRVGFRDGKIEAFNGFRSFWLEQFEGDEQRLELGLIQAAGFIQPNSPKPIEAQVSAQLARQCSEKRDRDKRYAKATETNTAARSREPPKTKHDTEMDEFRKAMIAPIMARYA